jgi:hypothetical protein
MQRKYPKEFKQYLKRRTTTGEPTVYHQLYLAWANGYKRGFEEQRASSDNLVKRWAIEKEIEDQVENMVYDIKGQMLCAAQNFINVMMEKLDE